MVTRGAIVSLLSPPQSLTGADKHGSSSQVVSCKPRTCLPSHVSDTKWNKQATTDFPKSQRLKLLSNMWCLAQYNQLHSSRSQQASFKVISRKAQTVHEAVCPRCSCARQLCQTASCRYTMSVMISLVLALKWHSLFLKTTTNMCSTAWASFNYLLSHFVHTLCRLKRIVPTKICKAWEQACKLLSERQTFFCSVFIQRCAVAL